MVSAFDFLALVSAFDADTALRYIFAVHRFFIFIRLLLHLVGSTSFSVHKIFVMSDRKLRSGTRRDYNKMAEGVDVPLDEFTDQENNDDGQYACAPPKNNNKLGNGGDILNYEVLIGNSDDSNVDGDDDSESSEGEEVRKATAKLTQMRKEQRKLLRKSKLERIASEAQEVEKSLKKLKENADVRKKKSKKVTAASLRGMDDVVAKVDRLMDKHMRIKVVSSSSEGEKPGSQSECEASADSDTTITTRSKSGTKKVEAVKTSGLKKSGKDKTLTSDVKYPQKWPQSHLSLHFVNNREKKYEELTLAEFCAGYVSIIEDEPEEKKTHRLTHLKELMYLATRYTWKCVLGYHAACVLEIERGHLKWGDSFHLLQSTTLAGGFLLSNNQNRGGNGNGSNRSSGSSEGRILFCRGYQRGTCQQTKDHYGQFDGESRLLKHICAKCWLKSRTISGNSENSEDCPLKDEL